MYITGHNRYSFSMDSAEIRVFKQMNEKGLAGLLQGEDRRTLPTEPSITIFATSVGNHVKRNLAHHARKGELAQEQVRTLLIPPDFAKGDRAWSVPPFSCRLVAT